MANRKMQSPINPEVVAIQKALCGLFPDDTDLLEKSDTAWYRGSEVTDAQQQAALERFKQGIRQHQQRKRRHTRMVICVAAFLLMTIGTVCLASGILPWKLDISWDDDKLHFDVKRTTEGVPRGTEPLSHTGVALDGAPIDRDVAESLPAYVPDGYRLSSASTEYIHDGWIIVNIVLRSDQDEPLSITWERSSTVGAYVKDAEKDQTILETYTVPGIVAYLYQNLGKVCAQWISTEGDQITIEGVLPEEELKKMIDSIGGNTNEV